LIDAIYNILHVSSRWAVMIVSWCLPIRSFVCVVTVQGVGQCMSCCCPHALYVVFHTHVAMFVTLYYGKRAITSVLDW